MASRQMNLDIAKSTRKISVLRAVIRLSVVVIMQDHLFVDIQYAKIGVILKNVECKQWKKQG